MPYGLGEQVARVPLPKGDIEEIVINYNPKGCVRGIKILSFEKELLYFGDFNYTNHTIQLCKGQRILGVKSKQ